MKCTKRESVATLKMQIGRISKADLRQGADRLHDLLDGRIVLPERLAVLLVGIGSAVIPVLLVT